MQSFQLKYLFLHFFLLLLISCSSKNTFYYIEEHQKEITGSLVISGGIQEIRLKKIEYVQSDLNKALSGIADSIARKVYKKLDSIPNKQLKLSLEKPVIIFNDTSDRPFVNVFNILNVDVFEEIPFSMIPTLYPGAFWDYYIQTYYRADWVRPILADVYIYDISGESVCSLESFRMNYIVNENKYFDADDNIDLPQHLPKLLFSDTDYALVIFPNRFYSVYWNGLSQFYYFVFRYGIYDLKKNKLIARGKTNKSQLFYNPVAQPGLPFLNTTHINKLIIETSDEIVSRLRKTFGS